MTNKELKEQAKLQRKIERYKRKKQLEENRALKGVTGFWSDFINFIKRGNALSMAIGVIVGGAFSAIVTSFNKDVIMPFIGGVMNAEYDVRGLEWHFENSDPIGTWVVVENADCQTHADENEDHMCDKCAKEYEVFNHSLDEYGNPMYKNMIYYGRLIQYTIDFVITAFILFIVLRIATSISNSIARHKKLIEDALYAEEPVEEVPAEPAPVVIPEDIKLLTEIRDLLKGNKDQE